jgi:long-chain acyl-CoA synthetase
MRTLYCLFLRLKETLFLCLLPFFFVCHFSLDIYMLRIIGRINPNGTISIIDRKKNIFKLSQGEYVAPEKIENVYARSVWVAQCFIYGDSLKSSLVSVIVPDVDVVTEWAKKTGSKDTFAELCASTELKKIIGDSMREVATAAKLGGFEQARSFILEATPFSVENDLLTPTFKLKRQEAFKKYKSVIDTMYKEIGE